MRPEELFCIVRPSKRSMKDSPSRYICVLCPLAVSVLYNAGRGVQGQAN